MDLILMSVALPAFIGFAALFIPKKLRNYGSFAAAAAALSVLIGGLSSFGEYRNFFFAEEIAFKADILSLILITLTGAFGFLTSLYSRGYFKKNRTGLFWSLLCWLFAASSAVFSADTAIIMVVSWGIAGAVLSLLVFISGSHSSAKKTFIIVGSTDALMIIGMAVFILSRSGGYLSSTSISLNEPLRWTAFITLFIAAVTKAGAMPFHTWIPDVSVSSAIPVTALLPASIDKMLGIYLLKKIMTDWFVISGGMNLVLMIVGSVTVVGGVFMALNQHNLKKLLGYHTVSQAGYMVLGLGTATPVGIAGGLLHMVNNSIYKQGLFLGAGVVENNAGTSDLDKLGGLSGKLPVTFTSFFICAMAISGLPPLSGFVSKWLIYQGIIEKGPAAGGMWALWLTAAVFGSALTLASFIKVLHSVFLGQPSAKLRVKKERLRWELPALVFLPAACLAIGIFPSHTAYPFLEAITGPIGMPGLWDSQLAGGFLLSGIAVGVVFYFLFRSFSFRVSPVYIGGEKPDREMRVSGVDFYKTIEEASPFKEMYGWARKGFFDLYELLKNFVFYWIRILKVMHTGVLNTYLLWVVVGSVLVFLAIFL